MSGPQDQLLDNIYNFGRPLSTIFYPSKMGFTHPNDKAILVAGHCYLVL